MFMRYLEYLIICVRKTSLKILKGIIRSRISKKYK